MPDQLELFHVEQPERPTRGGGRRWGGSDSRKAREYVATLLPAPCYRCGKPVTADMEWHADHVQEAAYGGADSNENYAPAHARCNTSAGGKLGAAITNGYRNENATTREVTVKWW